MNHCVPVGNEESLLLCDKSNVYIALPVDGIDPRPCSSFLGVSRFRTSLTFVQFWFTLHAGPACREDDALGHGEGQVGVLSKLPLVAELDAGAGEADRTDRTGKGKKRKEK